MTDLIKGLIEYFNTTPKDVLEKELAELEVFNSFGPEVSLYLESTEMHFDSICADDVSDKPIFDVNVHYFLAA